MTGNHALLMNFVEKFLGTVRFGNNDFAMIAGYGDGVIDSMMIKKVYYVEGLGHNLFSVFFLHSKDEASEVIISFIKKTQVNLQLQVQRVRTDNGTEFKNKTIAKFFDEVGITQQFFAAKIPQQNGVVERRNRTLVKAARTMLTFANLPSFIWAEAIATACFTQNRSIIHKRFDKIPYELINKRKPNIKFFRVFGCRCYLLNDYEDVGKLKAKGDIGVLELGLPNLNETGKPSNRSISKVDEALNNDLEDLFQDFYDEYFDSSKIMKSSTTNVETSINEEVFHEVSESFQGESSSSLLNDDVQQSPEEVILRQKNTQSIPINMIPNGDEASTSHNVFNERFEDTYFDAITSFHDPSNIMKSSTTNVKTPIIEEVFHEVSKSFQRESFSSSLNDDVQQSPKEVILPSLNTQSIPINVIPIGDEASTSHNVFNERLEDAYFDAIKCSNKGQLANSCLFSCLLSSIEPANVAEALRDADWVSAMQKELDQFARLEFGYSQQEGIDYDETFTLVARIEAICLFLAYVAHKDLQSFKWTLRQHFLMEFLKRKYMLVNLQENCDTVPTPMVEQAKLKLDLVGKPVDHTDYRSMIGSLMYATSSRPNIMFATCMCARYSANPNEHHVSAVKRIFRYLKGTINLGLWYPKDYGFDLTAYLDADHAGCHLDRKSTSGTVQFLGDKLVCWSSKKQNCVSISTAEFENVAVSGCCAQVLRIRTQLPDYGFFYDKVPIYCDSKSAIAISCNPVQHTRTKHIDVRTGIDLHWSLPSNLGKLGLGDGV
nr:uncharacterized mitochondrial protein AtMg00810-like [Tanacetum cinerariifolium]